MQKVGFWQEGVRGGYVRTGEEGVGGGYGPPLVLHKPGEEYEDRRMTKKGTTNRGEKAVKRKKKQK